MAEADQLITWLGFKFQPDAKKNIETAQKGFETLKNGVKGLNNFLFGAGGMWNYFKSNVMGGSQSMINLARQTGISTDNLQRWKYAAEVSGLSFQSLTGDLVQFKKLGYDVISLSKQFASVGQREAMLFKEKLGISDDMFMLLRQGPEALSKMGMDAPVIGGDKLKETAKMNQEFTKTMIKLNQTKDEILMKIVPTVLPLIEKLNAFLDRNKEWLTGNMEKVIAVLGGLFLGGKLLGAASAIISVLKGGMSLVTALTSQRALASSASAATGAEATGAGVASGGGMIAGAAKGLAGMGVGMYEAAQVGYAASDAMSGEYMSAAQHGLKAGFTGVASKMGGPFAGAAMAGLLEGAEWLGEKIGDGIFEMFLKKDPMEAAKIKYAEMNGNGNQTTNTNTTVIVQSMTADELNKAAPGIRDAQVNVQYPAGQ